MIENRRKHPIVLAIEPIQLCNAKCFCCPYPILAEDPNYTKQTMDQKNMSNLIDDFAGIRKRFNYKGRLRLNPFRFSDPSLIKNFDLILDKCLMHNIKIAFTTNGQNLKKDLLKKLDLNYEVIDKISISFIGSTLEEIEKNMGIDLVKVVKNINYIKSLKNLSSKLRITLRKTNNSKLEERNLNVLLMTLGYKLNGKIEIDPSTWLNNRIIHKIDKSKEYPTFINSKNEAFQSPENFSIGCHKIDMLDRMDVNLMGDVLLCCDDAFGLKKFGNVFDEGIDKIWNTSLKKEHELMFNKKYNKKKESLICTSCSRAIWSNKV